ncbi:hypothetical protein BaRGS_00035954 [Batillaria attramentaria]|uniref:Uncharacterized protein n=1 Tax=Batillaria attramentaria TaxID=370345 RepID=A0ABD0JDZ5_9CAEN
MESRNLVACFVVVVVVAVVGGYGVAVKRAVDPEMLMTLVQRQADTIQMLQTSLEAAEVDISTLKSQH